MRTPRAMSCAFALMGLLAAMAANSQQAQKLTCKSAQFSEAVRAKLLSIRDVCLEIVQRQGEPYAVVKAKVYRVRDDGVVVNFLKPDGSETERHFIPTHPDLRVDVNGEDTEVGDLSVGQQLTAYVKVTAPVLTFAQRPSAVPEQPAPIEEAPPAKAEPAHVAQANMPKTASELPLLALIGASLVALAAGLRRVRMRL